MRRFSDRGADARGDVLSRAIQIAAMEGFGAVTFDRLAKDLQRSKSGIFELFRSKEQLRKEVIDWCAELFQRMVVAPSRVMGGAAGLRILLERWLDYTVSDPGLVLAIASVVEFDEEYRPFDRIGQTQMFAIEGGILFGVQFGQLKKDVEQRELALDLYILGAGSAAAVMALGEGVREEVTARIDARFAAILTPEGAELVARALEEHRDTVFESSW